MIFNNEISFDEVLRLNYDPKFAKNAVFRTFDKSVKFYLTSINKDDFENLTHIYYENKIGPQKRRYGWALFDDNITKLSTFSNLLYSKDFIWTPTSEQSTWDSEYDKHFFKKIRDDFKWMKQALEQFDPVRARKSFWMIIGTSQNGPFMIMDGVHRAILTYMHYFIQSKAEFEPIERVVCCISNNTKLPNLKNIEKLI